MDRAKEIYGDMADQRPQDDELIALAQAANGAPLRDIVEVLKEADILVWPATFRELDSATRPSWIRDRDDLTVVRVAERDVARAVKVLRRHAGLPDEK
jgi:hypothetical protein